MASNYGTVHVDNEIFIARCEHPDCHANHWEADSKFIASAPADISFLLETVEKLREALEWYANANNVDYPIMDGNIARSAIESLE